LRTTIKDVAKEAHISTTAVSLVMNGNYEKVSVKTKERILAAAAKLNYRPSHIAMSMVTKTTRTIGLILPDISNIYFSELAKLIEQECYKNGYNILYGNTQDMPKRDIEYINLFLDRNVDAIIMVSSSSIDKHLHEIEGLIANTETPFIFLDRAMSMSNCTTIVVNQQLGGLMATQSLIDLGHRSIGCISGPKKVYSAVERLSGYKQALRNAGIPVRDDLIYEGDFHHESGFQALPYLLGKGVTAIFACNDMMALGVYKQAINYNISIPQDLSLIGYDDIFIADFLIPPLTSVEQPAKELALETINRVMDAINGKQPEKKLIIFEPILKVRGSTRAIQVQER